MKRLIGTVLFCMLFHLIHAQQLSPFVVSTSGEYFENSSGSISYTVGELALIETYVSADAILTQGFQQPYELTISVPEIESNLSMVVYPNPSDGNVNLVINTDKDLALKLMLFDNTGRVVKTEEINQAAGKFSYPFNWQDLSNGIYHLQITALDMHKHPMNIGFKTNSKINIIK